MDLIPLQPLLDLSDAIVSALAERLRAADFGPGILGEAEAVAPLMLDAVRLPLVQFRLAQKQSPGADLARLFAYADALPEARAREIFTDRVFDALAGAGVLAHDADGKIRSALRMLPVDDLWIVGDDPERGGDAVMSPGPTTLHVMRAMPSRCAGSVLDVGCGPGTMALVAARRGARHAVGCDIAERAIQAAKFNARLNGLRAEFVAGDLLEPVRGQKFDLVVSQPPYVIRPPDAAAVTYLHGGAMGDEIAMRLLGEIDDVIAPGGSALVLFDAPVRPREPLHARVRAALGSAPLDLLVLAAPGVSPDMQSIMYAALEHPDLGVGYPAAVRKYARHMADLGVTEFQHALLAMRRGRDATPGGRFTAALPVRSTNQCTAEALATLLAGMDTAGLDDAALSRAAVKASGRARWVEERERPDLGLEPARRVHFAPGSVASDREISEAGFVLAGALDASPTVEEAVALYAEACGTTPGEVRRQVLGFVREGLARGLLEVRAAASEW